MENWLLHPMRESNLQLFALVSIWISRKMHDSHPLSVKCLKSLGDKMIKEQHFTTRDFLESEVVLMQTSALYNSPKYLAALILACCFICYHSSKTEMGVFCSSLG
ncbi:hypothetical protein CsSME_00026941 [Camellia sinensis var. sinensis]